MPDDASPQKKPSLGRISYLNVLPIYHAMESGQVPHDYELVYGPPAVLNDMMAQGGLLAASTSCIEYARRPTRYMLLPDLAIGSEGPVQSVLLLSRVPIVDLDGARILVSAETHTSAALLRILLKERYKFNVSWQTGSATEMVATGNPPTAFLAIGDEALRLRRHPEYPYCLDLGEAWIRWTGKPFIFGVWVIHKQGMKEWPHAENPATLLYRSLSWGLENMDVILDIAERNYPNMTREEHREYFEGLSYALGKPEQEGLLLFWEKLASAGELKRVPPLSFLQ